MSDSIVMAIASAGAAVVGGALGVLGAVWQVRSRRWEMAGEVERSDATVLWNTLMEALRQQTEGQRALGERLDRLTDRLERLGRQWSETASRIDSLARDIQALAAAQRSLEEAVRNGGGNG